MKKVLTVAALAIGCTAMTALPVLAQASHVYSPVSKSWVRVDKDAVKRSHLGQAIHDANGTTIWSCAPNSHGKVGRCYPTKAVMQAE
ncbi:hypothetical protein RGUI_0411 [Rhodovulum sp. P5]|uniref:hypothetical protein n=1 Tax=Rhodovulum sp. P5 TaxID=1564506 RepID=UPI0009C1B6F0|nr:hypothetical protein [Rhodovulum sp. P5]ARE38552.1 hypothetical protein RGUI_0411 [Rhodovulum sp. P5]